MKNRFNFKQLILFIGILSIATSCSDYLEVNKTPNDPLADQVTPDLVLPGAETALNKTLATTMNRFGNVLMYNWGTDITAFAGGFPQLYSLNIDATIGQDIWDDLYVNLGKVQAIIDTEYENYENHIAIAKILKAYYFQYLVDLYGDLPYSGAFQRQEDLTPAYDDAYTVYKDLIVQLDSAQVLINNVTSETNLVGSEDVIFNGLMTKWSAFANTVKLKMLIRLSSNPEYSAYVEEQFQTLQGANFVTEDVTINPGFSNAQPNPFYDTYGFNVNGDPSGQHDFIRAAEYAVKYMNGSITGVSDPRLLSYYLPVDGAVHGVVQGVDEADPGEAFSELGPAYLKSRGQDGIVMLAATSYFLQAEAVFKGYLSGDAQALFEQGITASMLFHGIPQADITAYITASSGVDEIGWAGSSNKIEAIMTQKWLATNSINAVESFIDLNRTGFPELPLAITADRSRRPNRLLYPNSELISNADNVPPQTVDDAFTTYIFWDPEN